MHILQPALYSEIQENNPSLFNLAVRTPRSPDESQKRRRVTSVIHLERGPCPTLPCARRTEKIKNKILNQSIGCDFNVHCIIRWRSPSFSSVSWDNSNVVTASTVWYQWAARRCPHWPGHDRDSRAAASLTAKCLPRREKPAEALHHNSQRLQNATSGCLCVYGSSAIRWLY